MTRIIEHALPLPGTAWTLPGTLPRYAKPGNHSLLCSELRALDFLPNWSFVIVLIPFILYLVIAVVLPSPTRAELDEKKRS